MLINEVVSYMINVLLPFFWGIICGRLRAIGLALLFLPHTFLVAYFRDAIWGQGQTMILASIIMFYVVPSVFGYFIGYYWSKRKESKKAQKKARETERRPGLVRLL